MSNQNYYDTRCTQNATNEELRRAYKKMAVKWYPDKHATKTDSEKKDAEDKFKKMAEA